MQKRKLSPSTGEDPSNNFDNSEIIAGNEQIPQNLVTTNPDTTHHQIHLMPNIKPKKPSKLSKSTDPSYQIPLPTPLNQQQNMKVEILPSAKSESIDNKNSSLKQKIKSGSHPPKVIMLPDSLQSSCQAPKRRRVVRACDRCRKLKIKCSGDLPCIHCTVYNYECTYDQPNRSKRKNSVPIPSSNIDANNASTSSSTKPIKQSVTVNNPPINKPIKTEFSTSRKLNNNNNNNNNINKTTTTNNSNSSMDRFNSSTVSILASSNPELFSKLTDRLKLYDDILHRLLPEIKLTDLNDNPKPINPMKLMSALNKLKDMGKSSSKSSSKQIAKMYDSLPEMPLPSLPISKLPPNYPSNITPIQQQRLNNQQPISNVGNVSSVNPNAISPSYVNSSSNSQTPDINNTEYQGIDGSLESSLGKEIKIILPSREVALDLITKTWENACVLFRFYHRVAFIEDLNELYDTDPNHYTNKQQRFLPLVYSVMACGALFYKSDENTFNSKYDSTQNSDSNSNTSNSNTPGNIYNEHIQRKDFEDEGYRYFIAARKLIDITDTRDTYGIQTIVMLIIFLQCSARLSTCYAYIGIALRAALREGLHRKLDYPFNPIELEIRKRLFWTIYKMDIYVNTMLGLPRTISSDDFDQDMPIELDDENITVNGYRWDKQGDRLSSSGIANAHTRLIFLMKEVVTKLYPIKPKKISTLNNGNQYTSHSRSTSNHSAHNLSNNLNSELNSNNMEGTKDNQNSRHNEENNKVKSDLLRNNFVYDLELKLQDWMNSLPLELKPGVEPPGQYLKANRLLHISYLHVKIILYRPFIHYISAANVRSHSLYDLTCIEKAKNCINVARIVVKLAEDMINKNMLSGSYWFSIYTIFFSVACLVYYVHFAPPLNRDGKPDLEYIVIKKDAEKGKKVLDVLKDSSMAARRTYNILNALFEQLNRKTARAGVNSNPHFTRPNMGNSHYGTEKDRNQPQSESYEKKNYQFSTSSKEEVNSSDKLSHDNILPFNENIGNINNFDRFNQPQFQNQMQLNMAHSQSQFETQRPTESPSYPMDRRTTTMPPQYNDLSSSKLQTDSPTPFQNQGVFNKDSKVGTPDLANMNDITEYKYVPGPMDQMDMKIFGRFLPPYMLNNKTSPETANIESRNKNDSLKNGSNDVNTFDSNPMESTATPTDQDGRVFQPSLGLFTFVKGNNNTTTTNNNNNKDNTSLNANNNGTSSEFDKNALDEAVTNVNEAVDNKEAEKEGYPSTNWIDTDLLETTNDFFNQVTTANAIPSGLSTVFQSESDKNGIPTMTSIFDEPNSGVPSGGENTTDAENNTNSGNKNVTNTGLNNSEKVTNIELPSRFTSIEGIGMLDELLFGSGWDNANNETENRDDATGTKD